MTVNKKELLIYKLIVLYKEHFRDRRKLDNLSHRQLYNLFVELKVTPLILEWQRHIIRGYRKRLRDLPYSILELIESETRHIEVAESQLSDIIKMTIKYEEWDTSFNRSYRNLKLSRFFNMLSDRYNYLPIDYYKYGLDLESAKLTDLEDNLLLHRITKVVLNEK